MGKFIGSRTGIQCRSHHMKLLRTHNKIRKILKHFKNKLNISLEDQEYRDLFEELQNFKKSSNNVNPKNENSPLLIESNDGVLHPTFPNIG